MVDRHYLHPRRRRPLDQRDSILHVVALPLLEILCAGNDRHPVIPRSFTYHCAHKVRTP
jgi:hypothetical protein